jgi:MATE family multidrug resistance protein
VRFLQRERLRRILGLATPIVLGMMSQNVINLVDTAFVGRLGDAAIAAVGMGGIMNWLAGSLLIGMGHGVQAIAARRLGEGNPERSASGLNAALLFAAIIGLPLSFIAARHSLDALRWLHDDPAVHLAGEGYMIARFTALPCLAANVAFRGFWNGTNRPRNYLITLVWMHSLNVLLDYALIFGRLGMPELGPEGAGWASAIAMAGGTAAYVGLAWRQARPEGFLSSLGLRAAAPRLVRLAIPASGQQTLFAAGWLAFYWIAGQIGTAELAATNVIITLALVSILPALGMGLAGASIVGQTLGAGDFEDARRWGWEVVALGCIVMAVLGGLLAAGAPVWLRLFIPGQPATIAIAVLPLMILGTAQVLDGLGVVLSNLLLGVGDTLAVLRISAVCQWVIFLPVAYVVAVRLSTGLVGLFICMGAYRLLLGLALAARFRGSAWTRVEA